MKNYNFRFKYNGKWEEISIPHKIQGSSWKKVLEKNINYRLTVCKENGEWEIVNAKYLGENDTNQIISKSKSNVFLGGSSLKINTWFIDSIEEVKE